MSDTIYSFSRVSSYDNCAYSFYSNYILGAEQSVNSWASCGSVSHDTIEKVIKGEIDQEYATDYWIETVGEIDFPTMKRGYKEKYIDETLQFLHNFKGVNDEVIGVERSFLIDVDGVKFRGFIDLETRDKEHGFIKNIDWKSSGKSSFGTKKKVKEKARQLYLYAASTFEEFGEFPKELYFYLIRYNLPIKIDFNKKDYQEARDWLKRTVEKIESDKEFKQKPKKDFFCWSICGAQDCPLNGNYKNK